MEKSQDQRDDEAREMVLAIIPKGETRSLGDVLRSLEKRVKLTGPMVTKHFAKGDYNDIHPGAGAELQVNEPGSPWFFGAGGHYMTKDSFGKPMWWGGPSVGYTLGDRDGWWMEPGVTAGMMQKHEVNGGQVSPFALPRIGVGYGPVGADVGYIPPTPMNKQPIGVLLLQGKVDF